MTRKLEGIVTEVKRNNSWQNPITGVGGPRDKSANFVHVPEHRVHNSHQWQELYNGDDVAKKIASSVVNTAFSLGFKFRADAVDSLQVQQVNDVISDMDVANKMRRSLIAARRDGGAAMFIGTDDPNTEAELGEGVGVRFLTELEIDELHPTGQNDDPLKADFGAITHYEMAPLYGTTQQGTIIHASRIIRFDGEDADKRRKEQLDWWGESIYSSIYDALQAFHVAHKSACAAMASSNLLIYKLKGLAKILEHGEGELLRKRMDIVDRSWSAVQGIAIDSEGESVERLSIDLAELSPLLDRFSVRLAAAAEQPVAVFMGQQPAGLNATGESDIRLWYDKVASWRANNVQNKLESLVRRIIIDPDGPTGGKEPDEWSIEWPPLWQETGVEKATVRSTISATDVSLIDAGVLTARQVAMSRLSGDGYSTDIVLTKEELEAIPSDLDQIDIPFDSDAIEQVAGTEAEAETPVTTVEPAATPAAAQINSFELTASDLADIVTYDEARASIGLPPHKDPVFGALTVSQAREANMSEEVSDDSADKALDA
jgi:phage-related protein (TIGR01555 family)